MASPRQSGLYGALYLHVSTAPALASVVKVADTFNLAFETNVEMHNCTRKGEGFSRFMPGEGASRITGDANFQALAVLLSIAEGPLATPVSGTPYVRIAFKLVTNDGDQAPATVLAAADLPIAGQQIVQGFGWMARHVLNVPDDEAITTPFEIQVDGEWDLVTST